MKNIYVVLIGLAITMIWPGCSYQKTAQIFVENPSSFDRVDEPVVIRRSDIENLFGKSLPDDKIPMITSLKGEAIGSQADDLDGDGRWDELFTLLNLPASSRTGMKIVFVGPADIKSVAKRSNIWLASPKGDSSYTELAWANRLDITRENHGQTKNYFQFEGPGWENDLVGFRNYLDERNGIDIFGKKTKNMVLQNIGVNEDYHVMQDWGMDILKVGASLGAGSIALELNGVLHRVAPGSKGTYERLVNGPLRSILRFRFDNWKVGEFTCTVLHEITIFGGAWYYTSKVEVSGLDDNTNIVAGITTIDLKEKKAAFSDYENGVVSVSTHGNQSISGEFLGMALMLAKSDYLGYEYLDDKAGDINQCFIVRMKPADKPARFRFYSAWEKTDSSFTDPETFAALLAADAAKLSEPVRITFK